MTRVLSLLNIFKDDCIKNNVNIFMPPNYFYKQGYANIHKSEDQKSDRQTNINKYIT